MIQALHSNLLVGCCFLSLAVGVPLIAKGTGANVAVAQRGIDYVTETTLPFLVDFVSHYPLPDPVANGTDMLVKWSVGEAVLSDLQFSASAVFEAPSYVKVVLDIQSLAATARVS